MTSAEIFIAFTSEDGHAHVVIVPNLPPRRIELVGRFLVHDVGFFRIVNGYVRDMVLFFKFNGHFILPVLEFWLVFCRSY